MPYGRRGGGGRGGGGGAADTCAGVYGEYLKVNNPHKTSLYLASGIPVIIWKEAAMADYVEREKVGITISSMRELEDVFANLTEDQYVDMLQHAKLISKRLTTGYYTMEAVKKVGDGK